MGFEIGATIVPGDTFPLVLSGRDLCSSCSRRIAIIPTAQRFKPGERLRIVITSADEGFAMQGISHTTCGLAARNRVFAESRRMVL